MSARPWSLVFVIAPLVSACATSETGSGQAGPPVYARGPAPVLVGKRCQGETCTCRAARDREENPPPPNGHKRLEIRMSAAYGKASLDSPTLGHFEQAGLDEACFYVDVPSSKIYDFRLDSREGSEGGGVFPDVFIREYGPAGPYWYDVVRIACGIGDRSCDLDLARAWSRDWLDKRKRGRLDACGSMVVTGLGWKTSGGQSSQNGGALRDFSVDFSLEVKKFATQFPPNAPQCQISR